MLAVEDAEALIAELFEERTLGEAVASVEDLRVDGTRAEIEMSCGAARSAECSSPTRRSSSMTSGRSSGPQVRSRVVATRHALETSGGSRRPSA